MLLRGGPIPGYFQPMELRGPQGTRIGFPVNGQFTSPLPLPAKAGMLIGSVYRIKITNIPGMEGVEIFPTVEVIDRIYPPHGMENKFSIPIHLSQREIELAIRGFFITRVIYLEDPTNALPADEPKNRQRYIDVRYNEDPLRVADQLGRPVAILRIGSRYPPMDSSTGRFLFASPPLNIIAQPPAAPKPAATTEPFHRPAISNTPIPRLR